MRKLTWLAMWLLVGCGGSLAEVADAEAPVDEAEQALKPRYRFRVIDWNIANKEAAFAILEQQISDFNPDAVALQEVCFRQKQAWEASHPGWDVRFTRMTEAHPSCDNGPKGLMLASPRAMTDVTAKSLGESYFDPDIRERKHYKLLCGKVSTPEGRVKVCTTHLRTGDPGAAEARVVLTRRIVDFLFPTAVPVVLGGDFNAGPSSPELAVLHDRFHEADRGSNTPTHRGGAKIDHVFFNKKDTIARSTSAVLVGSTASDHSLYRARADVTF